MCRQKFSDESRHRVDREPVDDTEEVDQPFPRITQSKNVSYRYIIPHLCLRVKRVDIKYLLNIVGIYAKNIRHVFSSLS